MFGIFSFIVFFTLFIISNATLHSAKEWKDRTIYFVLTDRLARTDNSQTACSNLGDYCGGTFKGMTNHLDYIADMGFDAIWITPIIENTPGGYHGYWAKNLYKINDHYGTETDLLNFVKACHKKGIWVMLDIVINHVGPVGDDFSGINPFNKKEYYHDCKGCPNGCLIEHWDNQPEVEHCRLAGLPDLAQENKFVYSKLVDWVKWIVKKYSFDGLRLDTVPEVPQSFWKKFNKAIPGYKVGEVFNDRLWYVASYQQILDGVLSYPIYYAMMRGFGQKQSLWEFEGLNEEYFKSFRDPYTLGTFIDNHDNPRFRCTQKDLQLYKNALAYTLFSMGIPIIYYGAEQGYEGCADPDCREDIWRTGWNKKSEMYMFLQTAITYRKKTKINSYPQVQRYAENDFYAFTRGDTFIAVTNVGKGALTQYDITFHNYNEGQKLCNIWDSTDTYIVKDGMFRVILNDGMPTVLRKC